MTDADTLELISDYAGNCMTAFSVYLTVTFAFLTVSFLTGAKLTKFQARAVSGLYLISAFSSMMANLLYYQLIDESILLFSTEANTIASLTLLNMDLWKSYMLSLQAIGIAVSMYFLYDIRKRGISLSLH